MNLSAIMGIVFALSVFLGAIFTATKTRGVFLDPHAFLIVVGGTLAASMISYPVGHLLDALKIFFRKVVGQYGDKPEKLIQEIVKLSEGLRTDPQFLSKNVDSVTSSFLKDALSLFIEGGLPFHEIAEILEKRAEVIFLEHEEEAHTFKTMAKFPPAFGLLGAVMGMVSLMQGLGSPDSFKTIGPSMAMAMVATLYGIAIANFVLIPVSENLSRINKQELLNRNIIIDGIRLLHEKKHPLIVEESLKSYLRPRDRQKEAKGNGTDGKTAA